MRFLLFCLDMVLIGQILVDKIAAMEGFIEIPYENFLDYVNEFRIKNVQRYLVY